MLRRISHVRIPSLGGIIMIIDFSFKEDRPNYVLSKRSLEISLVIKSRIFSLSKKRKRTHSTISSSKDEQQVFFL